MSKIGRPPIPPAERRTKIVQVPVNVAELDALDALRTEGESRAAAVRRAVDLLGQEGGLQARGRRDGGLRQLESLAALEHEQWAHWTAHMLDVLGPYLPDGAERALVLEFKGETTSPKAVACSAMRRWYRQMEAPYADLSESEKPSELAVGFYVAFGSDLGVVGFFRVKRHPEVGLVVWGLSRWRGRVAYRTRGVGLEEWLARQETGVQYRRDRDRTGWPGAAQ